MKIKPSITYKPSISKGYYPKEKEVRFNNQKPIFKNMNY